MASHLLPHPGPSTAMGLSSPPVDIGDPTHQSNPQPSGSKEPARTGNKKRKVDTADEGRDPAQRRLRRLHEACARCRSKKIKCDSKHPSCSSCEAAGVECNQEDRHRQTLKPRGYTERIEAQLHKCNLILRKYHPDFNVDNIDEILDREGIPRPADDFNVHSPLQGNFPASASAASGSATPKSTTPANTFHPANFTPSPSYSATTPVSAPIPLADPAPNIPGVPAPQTGSPSRNEVIKGQDPYSNDLSSTSGLVRAFGVSKAIAKDIRPDVPERDEVNTLSGPAYSTDLKRSTGWLSKPIPRRLGVPSVFGSSSNRLCFLPSDRAWVNRIVGCYFNRLNWHRPVFLRHEFVAALNALYDSVDGIPSQQYPRIADDPGFLFSFYIILALGSLSEDNCRLHNVPNQKKPPPGWPTHEEFFNQALAIKPDLRVTISTLQGLILLHWYMYTERHGRTLWRLVGNLVRLGVELGLHHDPTTQQGTFSREECQQRMRLWWIVMIHDRGTSILLGRPLAISDEHCNTMPPSRDNLAWFSEHFHHSPYITQVQGDIVQALYRPGKHPVEQILKYAMRIEQSFLNFRNILPSNYLNLFTGTASWTPTQRVELVLSITEEQGLTMLKYGIARILMLRALFNLKELDSDVRHRALQDAVITSHNVLIIHAQMTMYPNIAFFVSPIPIHIAAMVILYAVISQVETIPYNIAKEDVCIALKLVPLFRWRWHRKDSHGSHPLIVRVAQKVFGEDLLFGFGPTGPPMLIEEMSWASNLSHPPPVKPEGADSTSSAVTNGNGSSYTNGFVGQAPPTPAPSSSDLLYNTGPIGLNGPPPAGIFFPAPLNLTNTTIPTSEFEAANELGAGPPDSDDVASLLIQLGEQQAPGNVDYGQSESYFVSEEYDKESSMASIAMLHNTMQVDPWAQR